MSNIYKCNHCQRAFTTKQVAKAGLNKMFKAYPIVAPATSTFSAGDYTKGSTVLCPYCMSSDTEMGLETTRVKMLLGKFSGKYPKPDIGKYRYLQEIQCYKDCFINVSLETEEIHGINDDGEKLVRQTLDAYPLTDKTSIINKLDNDFTRPIIVHDKDEDLYYVRENGNTIFAAKRNKATDEYDISDDGTNFIPYTSNEKQADKIVEAGAKAIGDYAFMIEF